jgi:hypothetical protein
MIQISSPHRRLEELAGRGEGIVIVEATSEDANMRFAFPEGKSTLFITRVRHAPLGETKDAKC